MKVLNNLIIAGNASAKNLSGTNTGDQDLTPLIPYVGATTNVDLGNYSLKASKFALKTNASNTLSVGEVSWNAHDMTLDVKSNGATLQVNQEQVLPVKNETGSTMLNGRLVRITGYNAAEDYYTIVYSDNSSESLAYVDLMLTESIASNSTGLGVKIGIVHDLDTSSGSMGAVAYLGTNGQFTNIAPSYPNKEVVVGTYGKIDNTTGELFVDLNKTGQYITNAISTELDLKAMQNPGVCQKCPILPIDIVIDTTNLTFSIVSTKGGTAVSALNPIRVFTDGSGIINKWEKTTVQTVSFTKTNGVWYFHFDNTGTLIATQTPWSDFNIVAPIYRFYLNDQLANASMITVRAWEAHLNDISASDHEWKHAQGTIYESGFAIVCTPLTSGTPNVSGINTCLSLTTGKNSDDGLEYTITNTQTPTIGFQQDLGITTANSITISNGALFKVRTNDSAGRLSFLDATRFPFAWDIATNRPQYITALGVRTLVTDNRWFVYYVYALQDDKVGEAIKIVSAETEFTSLVLAQAHAWENLQALYATLNDKEIRPLYKVIFYNDNSGGGAFSSAVKYSVIREFTDIRRQKVTNTSASAGSVLASNVVTIAGTNLLGTNAETKFTEVDTYITNHKPWLTSGHTGNANKLMATDVNGVASEIDAINTYSNKIGINGFWTSIFENTGTITASGTTLTLTGGNIRGEVIGSMIIINGARKIITKYSTNPKTYTIDSAYSFPITDQPYEIHIPSVSEYGGDLNVFNSLGRPQFHINDQGLFFDNSIKNGVRSETQNSATASFTAGKGQLRTTKAEGSIENDGAKLFFTDLNLVRRALATEDNFTSYQQNAFYSTGTVSVSGTTVTIVGGTFSPLMANNSKIRFSNGEERDLKVYTDSTHFTIDRTTGGTLSGVTFSIYLKRLFDNGTNLVVTNNDGSTFNISNSGGGGTPTSRQIIADVTVGSIIGGGDLTADRTLTLSGDAVSPGNLKMYSTNTSGVKGWNSRSYMPLQYNLLEDVNNNAVYFYSYIQANANTTSVRSGNASNGLGIAYGASPIILPQSGTIIGATFTVVGAAVANGTVTYPCLLRTTLYNVGWTTEGTSISNIDCSIPSSSTPVGTYSVASTNGIFATTGLSIAVTAGQPLALKWIPQTGASGINIIRNVIVTLWFIPN